jgi:hypothetical protein
VERVEKAKKTIWLSMHLLVQKFFKKGEIGRKRGKGGNRAKKGEIPPKGGKLGALF